MFMVKIVKPVFANDLRMCVFSHAQNEPHPAQKMYIITSRHASTHHRVAVELEITIIYGGVIA